MKQIVGYMVMYNHEGHLAGDIVRSIEFCEKYPERFKPVFIENEVKEERKTTEEIPLVQRVRNLEDRFGILKMYIKNL